MKKLFTSRRAKTIVDTAMLLAFMIGWLCSDPGSAPITRWRSPHCITGAVLLLLITAHIIQHWRFVRALTKKKVFLKNKITAFTVISFILTAVSVLLFIAGFNHPALQLHHVAGHFFPVIVIIHVTGFVIKRTVKNASGFRKIR